MLLATYVRWLDSILYEFTVRFQWLIKECTPRLVRYKLAIDGLLFQYVYAYYFSLH